MIKKLFNNDEIHTSVYMQKSDKTESGIRIAHLSDLHEKEFGEGNRRLFAEVAKLEPDLIAITGDLVAHETQKYVDVRYARELAEGLCKIAPVFFVTGNHEKNYDEAICDALWRGGATVLKGEVTQIYIREALVNIGGTDDVSYRRDAQGVIDRLGGMDGYNIFLTHHPEVFDQCAGRNIDLVLAGHTHDGQIRIPVISSLYMSGQGWRPKYMRGRHAMGGATLIISRGLGASGYPRIRFNNPPDLVAVLVTGA